MRTKNRIIMRQKIILYVLLFILLTSISCTKNKENNIIGTWTQMRFMVEDSTTPVTRWSFSANMTVTARVIREEDDSLLTSIGADYSISFKKLGYRLEITKDTTRFEVNGIDFRGVYVIEELSRDVLRLVRIEGHNNNGEWSTEGDAFVQLEFLKD